jgi:hypothetical protein
MTVWDFLNNNILWILVGIPTILVLLRLLNFDLTIGKFRLSSKKMEILTDYIRTVTKLEVERETAPTALKESARRIVKNYVTIGLEKMRQLEIECRCEHGSGCPDRDRIYEMITAGPVKDYLVSEFMEIVEQNHIADMSDAEFLLKNQSHFERLFTGVEAVTETSWVDSMFDVILVRNKMRTNSHEFIRIFTNLMNEIRNLAIKYANRKSEIEEELNTLTSALQKKGRM